MKEQENLKEGRLITLKSRKSMLDLLYQSCINGLNCLCLLDLSTREYLVQKLLLKHAGVNLDENITVDDYKYLVRAMHDICKWGLYIDKFHSIAKTNNKIKKLKPDYVFIESEQDIFSDKHWKTMAERRQVVIVLISYNDEIFNEDGKHKLENENNSAEIQGIKKAKNYRMLNKNFKKTSDFKSVIIDNQTYYIPDYFNVDMVKKEDEKTWQMIFYQIFADDINTELSKRG